MIYISHRHNTAASLQNLDPAFGVEIDLRSDVTQAARLHLSHDAGTLGEDFSSWLAEYKKQGIRGPIILNTKEDGLEDKILNALKLYQIENYFFLDTTLPTLVRYTGRLQQNRFAVRVSKFEPAEFALKFSGRAKFAWIDCFEGHPLSTSEVKKLADHFELCLVSPELQTGQTDNLVSFAELAQHCQMICTKVPDAWKKILEPSVHKS